MKQNVPGVPVAGAPGFNISELSDAEKLTGLSTEQHLTGLSTAQVQERVARGAVNKLPPRSGKSVADIVRSNVFTRINAILGVLLAFVITTGSWINCAFGLLIVINSAIGIIQELRAKHTLDSLSLIGEEHPRVLRDGEIRELPRHELVIDDVIALGAGRQIVVDGEVIASDYLAVNESLLTGEADYMHKEVGDKLLSGSFVTAGTGYYRVTAVGADSYAAQLAAQASHYTLSKSHLQASIDRILRVITWILVPVAAASVISQLASGVADYRATVLEITGALVPMVPEGLVLITSTAFALGVIRLGKRKCLVQELPAIEGLARVDVVCADKTGTLTEGTMQFSGLDPIAGAASSRSARELVQELTAALAQIVYADPDRNATTEAIATALQPPAPGTEWDITARVPFTSANKWSAVTFADHGTWLLGAPEVLSAPASPAAEQAAHLAATGLRVLLLAHYPARLASADSFNRDSVTPLACLILEQTIRPDTSATLDYFRSQDVAVKVISGDNPASVAAVTARLGVTDTAAVDARTLDELSEAQLATTLEEHNVFGRVRPEQKQQMVAALQKAGHTVAMTGDGVNDVLALKNADIGVAMGSGSSAARAVAKIVLLDNRFATLPYVVGEGRRVIGNIERVANLFLTKTTYSALLALLVIITAVPFPFQPIHVTITGWFTIGLPAFILSLPPNNTRAKAGFSRRVLGFAIPAGVIVAASSFSTYLIVTGNHVPEQHVQASTAALLALIIPSVWVLACVARPWNTWKIALFLTPPIGYGLIFTLPITQHFFILDSSNIAMMSTAAIIGAIGALGVEATWHIIGKRLRA